MKNEIVFKNIFSGIAIINLTGIAYACIITIMNIV